MTAIFTESEYEIELSAVQGPAGASQSVNYVAQTLTTNEKAQARSNISAQLASANLDRLDGTAAQQRAAISAAATAVANSFAQTQTFTGKIAVSETTGSDVGVIQIGNMRVHTFFPTGGDTDFGRNLFIGENAGNFTLTTSGGTPEQGIANLGIGHNALLGLTTGYRSVAIGNGALKANTTGYHNVAVGMAALEFNTTGHYNTACGQSPLYSNTTGVDNGAFAADALFYNTTGSRNNALGRNALFTNTTGNENSAFGHEALYDNTTGSLNSAFGFNSLGDNTTGNRNSAYGVASLRALTTGSSNTGIGDSAGLTITTGSNNVCIGKESGNGLTTGSNNVVIGSATMSAADAGYVVIADGLGNRRIVFDGSGNGSIDGVFQFNGIVKFASPIRDTDGANRIRMLTTGNKETEISSGGTSLTGLDVNGSTCYEISATRAYFGGTMVCRLEASETLAGNRQMCFEAVSNTQVRLKYRGLDGVSRTTTFTLS